MITGSCDSNSYRTREAPEEKKEQIDFSSFYGKEIFKIDYSHCEYGEIDELKIHFQDGRMVVVVAGSSIRCDGTPALYISKEDLTGNIISCSCACMNSSHPDFEKHMQANQKRMDAGLYPLPWIVE